MPQLMGSCTDFQVLKINKIKEGVAAEDFKGIATVKQAYYDGDDRIGEELGRVTRLPISN